VRGAISFVKESGLLGSLLASLIVGLAGLSIPILKRICAFDHTISLQLSLYSLSGGLIMAGSLLFFVYRYMSNTTRMYSSVLGYYRSNVKATYTPYVWRAGKYVTHHHIEMVFRVTRDGVTSIGPLSYYAYRPHTTYGKESIENRRTDGQVAGNGRMKVEASPIGTDAYNFTLRTNHPLKSGDRVFFILDLDIIGQHAMFQEELDWYKSLPDLDNTLRNRLIRENNAELVGSTTSFASHFDYTVTFPDNYPWKVRDETYDMAAITMSARPVSRRLFKKYAKITITERSINLSYGRRFSAGHGYYIFWRLPTKNELEEAGFLEGDGDVLQ
jgi:hypothetical protein